RKDRNDRISGRSSIIVRTVHRHCGFDRHLTMSSLYARLLGASFENLSPVLQRIHDARARKRYAGRCTIERGRGILARVLATIARLPPSHEDIDVELAIECRRGGETWGRRFGTHWVAPVLRGRSPHLEERPGAVPVRFRPAATPEGIPWLVGGAAFLLVPPPVSWFAACEAHETTDGTQYRFDVRAEMRGVGLLVRYSGWMGEHESRIE